MGEKRLPHATTCFWKSRVFCQLKQANLIIETLEAPTTSTNPKEHTSQGESKTPQERERVSSFLLTDLNPQAFSSLCRSKKNKHMDGIPTYIPKWRKFTSHPREFCHMFTTRIRNISLWYLNKNN